MDSRKDVSVKRKNQYFSEVFSVLLKEWCKTNGRTQAEFADVVGVHQNMISRYKKGDAYPTDDVIERTSELFGVDESVFFPDKRQIPLEENGIEADKENERLKAENKSLFPVSDNDIIEYFAKCAPAFGFLCDRTASILKRSNENERTANIKEFVDEFKAIYHKKAELTLDDYFALDCIENIAKKMLGKGEDNKSIELQKGEFDDGFGIQTFNCLHRAGIKNMRELSRMKYNELIKLRCLGRKKGIEITLKLKKCGYSVSHLSKAVGLE